MRAISSASESTATAPPAECHGIIQQFRLMPVRTLARVTLREARSDDLAGLAAEITYHTLYTIPPAMIFLLALAAIVNQATSLHVDEELRSLIYQSVPGEAQILMTSFVEQAVTRVDAGLASFGVMSASAIALWSGSNALLTMDKAFNRAYDVVETRSWVHQRLVNAGLTLLMLVMVLGSFVLFVFGRGIGAWVADRLGQGSLFIALWGALSWPLAVVMVVIFLAILYYLGPDVEQSFRWITPGSIVATFLWFVLVFGFRLYLWVADPGLAYGAFAGVVLLMTLLYLSSVIFLVGAEINAVLGRRYDPDTIQDLLNHPDKLDRPEDVAEARRHAAEFDRRGGEC